MLTLSDGDKTVKHKQQLQHSDSYSLYLILLVEMGHGDPPLGLLHHVGLVPQVDADDGRRQLTGLTIHLHGDGLVGGEGDFFTLVETFTVSTHLQRGLDTNIKRGTSVLLHLTVSLEEHMTMYRAVWCIMYYGNDSRW